MKFELNKKEVDKLKEWKEAIKVIYGEYGKFTYSFTPTGIANHIEVYSELANKSIDLTDVDSW